MHIWYMGQFAFPEVTGKSGNRLPFNFVDNEKNEAMDCYIGVLEMPDLSASLVKAADMPENWKTVAFVQYLYVNGKRMEDRSFYVGEYPTRIPIISHALSAYLKSPLRVIVDSKLLSRTRYRPGGPYG